MISEPSAEFNLEDFLASLNQYWEEGEQPALPSLFDDPETMIGYNPEFEETEQTLTRLSEPVFYHNEEIPEMVSRWNELMVNFKPDDMIAFDLEVGGVEVPTKLHYVDSVPRCRFPNHNPRGVVRTVLPEDEQN
jgi:hypothetical protein